MFILINRAPVNVANIKHISPVMEYNPERCSFVPSVPWPFHYYFRITMKDNERIRSQKYETFEEAQAKLEELLTVVNNMFTDLPVFNI